MSSRPNKISSIRHEAERGEVLRYLRELGLGVSITPERLRIILDCAYCPISERAMDFHLRYLGEKGWIEIEFSAREVGEMKQAISTVRITAAGIDLLDRRAAGDKGVRFA